MKICFFLLPILWLVCAYLHCIGRKLENRVLYLLPKVIPTLTAAVLGLAGFLRAGNGYTLLMTVGLFLGAAADVLLNVYFVVGGVVFGLGHLAYLAALLITYPVSGASVILYFAIVAALALVGLCLRAHWPKPGLLACLAVYSLILAGLPALGIPPAFTQTSVVTVTAAAGSVLFPISDAALAGKAAKKDSLWYEVLCLFIYYAAQTALGLSAFLWM